MTEDSNETIVNLDTLAKGAASELFQDALDDVVANILDINTDLSTREIHLIVKIKPNSDERRASACTITTKRKLAAPKPINTTLYFGREKGKAVAVEYDPNQRKLFEGSFPDRVPEDAKKPS